MIVCCRSPDLRSVRNVYCTELDATWLKYSASDTERGRVSGCAGRWSSHKRIEKRDQTKDSGSERRWRELEVTRYCGHRPTSINFAQFNSIQLNAGFLFKRNRYLYLTWVCREHPPWRRLLLQPPLAHDPFRLDEHRRFLARLTLILRVQPRLEVVGTMGTVGCAVVVVCRRCGGNVGT